MTKRLILPIFFLVQVCCAQTSLVSGQARVTPLTSEDSSKITELFFAGLKEKMANNFEKSDAYYQQIIAIDPSNDATLFELAKSYHAQNLEKEAAATALAAISLKPANEWYWVLMADIYEKTDNLPGLLNACNKLIEIAPGKEGYYFDKASVLFELNRMDDALAVYDLIERKKGTSVQLANGRQRVYQKQNMTNRTASGLEEIIKNDPENLGNYIALSQLYYSSGNKDKALEVLLSAKKENAADVAVRINLADIYRTEGQSAAAFSELKAAIEYPKMDVESKINAVLSLSAQVKEPEVIKQALELSAILVKLYPKNNSVRSLYGDILQQNGRRAEARQSYLLSLRIDEHDYPVWESLILMDLTALDFSAAIKDAEQALKVFPDHAALSVYMGKAYYGREENETAISYFKAAIDHEKENKLLLSDAYASLGDSFHRLRHDNESDQFYEKALEINPDNTNALHQYAAVLASRGSYNLVKAEQMAHRAIELKPDSKVLKSAFERISFLNGKYRSAASWVENNMGGLELSSQDYLVWENILQMEYEIGEFDALIENAGKTIIIFPDQARPYWYAGLAHLQKKKFDIAREYFQKALSIQKDNSDLQSSIYCGLGDLYAALKNDIESDKAFEKAVQLNPFNLYALNAYASSLASRKVNLDKAELMSRQTNELNPDNSFFESTYSIILFKQKKYKEARTWAEKAIKDAGGNNPELFEHYGDILSGLSETDLAVEQWTIAKNKGVKSANLERKIIEKKYVE